MHSIDTTYHSLLEIILQHGFEYEDRSREIGRRQIPNYQLGHNFNQGGFPVMTTKRLFWKGIVTELIWFLRGEMTIDFLHEHGVRFWDKDTETFRRRLNDPEYPETYVGKIYGYQWRQFGTQEVDQFQALIKSLSRDPLGTRHIVTAWNPEDLEEMALPPCHWSFELLPIEKDHEISFYLKWHQRSVDVFLGLPFNIASYALLGRIIEELTGIRCEGVIGDLSNVHIYLNHTEAVKTMLERNPSKYAPPQLQINTEMQNLFLDYRIGKYSLDQVINRMKPSDFTLQNYQCYPTIQADMVAPKL